MDITVDRRHAPPARRHRRVPWSPRMWSQALYLAAGIPAQLIAPLILLGVIRWALVMNPRGIARLALLWLACAVVIAVLVPALTRVHRHRLRATAGVDIPPQPKRGVLTWRGIAEVARSQATWRQLCYHLLAAPALAAAAATAVGMWLAGIVYGFIYTYGWALPAGGALRRATYPVPLPQGGVDTAPVPTGVWLTIVGLGLLFIAPWYTSVISELDILAARKLLGLSRADELEHQVEHLTQTRAGAVDAADAERRRLERDLHDGTQQRLVSLAINLGMARAQAGTAEEAKQAIAEAHEEAKAALAELRDLIRGLHPAVLEDRGLDAALSGVAARMPIPVRLTVDLPRRPAPVIEAVAYFVVSEGLANIAKHSQATEAAVFVQRAGDRLHVIVTDDGVGGADPARGTGLVGLARRAASVDGTFEIDSPPGGPTLITVDLPCHR
jgi:signal transduction histidine kinase